MTSKATLIVDEAGPGPLLPPAVRRRIERVARRETTVLITGESGTGKEVTARLIHRLSRRARGPFVPIECTALNETLIESQLFGHVRGAFTGAVREAVGFIRAAEGGTALLDEIGELPPALQAKLLRCLQERQFTALGSTRPQPVDVRFIAATNRALEPMVADGRFRADLFYRLNVINIPLPPLRERSDLLPLARQLLDRIAALYEEPAKSLDLAAAELLQQYHWPGNIRELANAMEHGFVMSTGPVVGPIDLPSWLQSCPALNPDRPDAFPTLGQTERAMVLTALDRAAGNKTRAALALGIPRQRLYRLIARHRLHV